VVVQVEEKERRQEQQPEQSQGMEILQGTRQQAGVAESRQQDQHPGERGHCWQRRGVSRHQTPRDFPRKTAPDEALRVIDQPVGIRPVIQAGAESVFGEPVEEIAHPRGAEDQQQ
jgi:hypothetical protein